MHFKGLNKIPEKEYKDENSYYFRDDIIKIYLAKIMPKMIISSNVLTFSEKQICPDKNNIITKICKNCDSHFKVGNKKGAMEINPLPLF